MSPFFLQYEIKINSEMSGGSPEVIDAFCDESCHGWAIFGNVLLLDQLFHYLTEPEDWLSAVLVCKPFKAVGYRNCIRKRVHRVLCYMVLKVSLVSGNVGCFCSAWRQEDRAEVLIVEHRRVRNHHGFRVEGRNQDDDSLVYEMGIAEDMESPLKKMCIYGGASDSENVRALAWTPTGNKCGSIYLNENYLTRDPSNSFDSAQPDPDIDW